MTSTTDERFDIREEIKVIPAWAIVVAVLIFVGFQLLLHVVLFPGDPHAPPVAVRVFIGLLPGTLFAFLALLIGYVNRDAKRRGMNRALWTILVIFIPNAIGFIIYFLARHPLLATCPKCGAAVNPAFNFCPKCKFNLHPTCPQCQHAIEIGGAFCPYCAHELKGVTQ
ncbi:MAG: zinc ribbon domain-containing protein [Terriglobia bacterium]